MSITEKQLLTLIDGVAQGNNEALKQTLIIFDSLASQQTTNSQICEFLMRLVMNSEYKCRAIAANLLGRFNFHLSNDMFLGLCTLLTNTDAGFVAMLISLIAKHLISPERVQLLFTLPPEFYSGILCLIEYLTLHLTSNIITLLVPFLLQILTGQYPTELRVKASRTASLVFEFLGGDRSSLSEQIITIVHGITFSQLTPENIDVIYNLMAISFCIFKLDYFQILRQNLIQLLSIPNQSHFVAHAFNIINQYVDDITPPPDFIDLIIHHSILSPEDLQNHATDLSIILSDCDLTTDIRQSADSLFTRWADFGYLPLIIERCILAARTDPPHQEAAFFLLAQIANKSHQDYFDSLPQYFDNDPFCIGRYLILRATVFDDPPIDLIQEALATECAPLQAMAVIAIIRGKVTALAPIAVNLLYFWLQQCPEDPVLPECISVHLEQLTAIDPPMFATPSFLETTLNAIKYFLYNTACLEPLSNSLCVISSSNQEFLGALLNFTVQVIHDSDAHNIGLLLMKGILENNGLDMLPLDVLYQSFLETLLPDDFDIDIKIATIFACNNRFQNLIDWFILALQSELNGSKFQFTGSLIVRLIMNSEPEKAKQMMSIIVQRFYKNESKTMAFLYVVTYAAVVFMGNIQAADAIFDVKALGDCLSTFSCHFVDWFETKLVISALFMLHNRQIEFNDSVVNYAFVGSFLLSRMVWKYHDSAEEDNYEESIDLYETRLPMQSRAWTFSRFDSFFAQSSLNTPQMVFTKWLQQFLSLVQEPYKKSLMELYSSKE